MKFENMYEKIRNWINWLDKRAGFYSFVATVGVPIALTACAKFGLLDLITRWLKTPRDSWVLGVLYSLWLGSALVLLIAAMRRGEKGVRVWATVAFGLILCFAPPFSAAYRIGRPFWEPRRGSRSTLLLHVTLENREDHDRFRTAMIGFMRAYDFHKFLPDIEHVSYEHQPPTFFAKGQYLRCSVTTNSPETIEIRMHTMMSVRERRARESAEALVVRLQRALGTNNMVRYRQWWWKLWTLATRSLQS